MSSASGGSRRITDISSQFYQIEEHEAKKGFQAKFYFEKPAGFSWSPDNGWNLLRLPRGEVKYKVSLNLTKYDGDGFPTSLFFGTGWSPLDAIENAMESYTKFPGHGYWRGYSRVTVKKKKVYIVKEDIESYTKKINQKMIDASKETQVQIKQLKFELATAGETNKNLEEKLNDQTLSLENLMMAKFTELKEELSNLKAFNYKNEIKVVELEKEIMEKDSAINKKDLELGELYKQLMEKDLGLKALQFKVTQLEKQKTNGIKRKE